MKPFAILASLLLVQTLNTFGQGSLTYQTTLGVGKEKYLYLPNPSNPTVPKNGGGLADYANFTKIEGDGYYAELWWAPGENQPADCLKAVPGSLVTFRTGTTAGLIKGKSKLDIAGTYGGDIVTLQLRVWDNQGGTLQTWDAALDDHTIRLRGASNLFNHELAGARRDGGVSLGSGSIANGLTYASFPVPEPSSIALALLGLGGLAFGRIRGASRSRS